MTAKQFLKIYFVAYVVLLVVGMVLFKSPTFSSAFEHKYGADLERYHEILKNPAYKAYAERPHLAAPDAALKAEIAFVEEFEQNADFKAEEHRFKLYILYSKWMNSLMFVWLVVHFARKPLCSYLDAKIAEIRQSLDEAEQARAAAAKQREEASRQLESFPKLAEDIHRQADADVAAAVAHANEEGQRDEHQLAIELEDRKRDECAQAVATIRREMVERAIEQVRTSYNTDPCLKDLSPCVAHFEKILEHIT